MAYRICEEILSGIENIITQKNISKNQTTSPSINLNVLRSWPTVIATTFSISGKSEAEALYHSNLRVITARMSRKMQRAANRM